MSFTLICKDNSNSAAIFFFFEVTITHYWDIFIPTYQVHRGL